VITATHSRKARREGRCNLCGHTIRIGQRIVRVGYGGSWLHAGCFLLRYRPTQQESP
jgi:hypothetical protein